MTSSLYWIFIWNIVVNSLLTFVTLSLLIEVLFKILPIRHERFKLMCRCIPFLKLPLDLFLYDFSGWALANGINPLEAAPGTRQLTCWFLTSPSTWLDSWVGISFKLQSRETFSLADITALSIGKDWLRFLVSAVILISVLLGVIKTFRYRNARRYLNDLISNARPCTRIIVNASLGWEMHFRNIRIYESDENSTPFCGKLDQPVIVFPAPLLLQLSQAEFEAALAHEIEHLRFHDTTLCFVLDVMSTVFWWLPTQWVKSAISKSQEKACDLAIVRHGIHKLDLASAITKAVRFTQPMNNVLASSLFFEPSLISQRLHALLEPKFSTQNRLLNFAVAIVLVAFLTGRFWIF